MADVWKPIVGYEGLYEVNNNGVVRSIAHKVDAWFGSRTSPSKVIKAHHNSNTQYLYVCLCKNNVKKTHLVHRLVASAFLDNPQNLPQVNHKNENKIDNRAENLEWCTVLYNNNYGTKNQRLSEKNKISKCKPVAQIKNGIVINTFPSAISANAIADPAHIGQVCMGKRNSAGGYQWKFVNGG